MLFDPEALRNKERYLDAVLEVPELVRRVVSLHLDDSVRLRLLPRIWEPGGGATLFRIESFRGIYLLKVKHRSVWVESRLESEDQYLRKPSLQNEYEFIKTLNTDWVPKVVFFEEHSQFQFLAIEWLETFDETVHKMSAPQLLKVWEQIVHAVRTLYDRGLVHTDIHEYNICFRNSMPVICDFEEARFFKQDMEFGESLDVVGANKYGNVGEFPSGNGRIGGLTCLQRLTLIFKTVIRERLPKLIAECNFDDRCPFNLDDFQEPDARTYQSIDLPGINIEGQRPKEDPRLLLFSYLLHRLARKEETISHADIGSNLGTFCFQAASYPFVKVSIGIEPFIKYVDVARILAFLYNFTKVRFLNLVCGEDDIIEHFQDISFVTMLSVYHHIVKKDAFLHDLKKVGAKYLLAEFATQDRYYPERGNLSAELEYIKRTIGYSNCSVLAMSRDYQRPMVLFSNEDITHFERIFLKIVCSHFTALGRAVLTLVRPINRFLENKDRLLNSHRYFKSIYSCLIPSANAGEMKKGLFKEDLPSHCHTALEWIENNRIHGEGIQICNTREEPYPEVTGYYIPTLLDCGRWELSVEFAHWLMSIQNPDGSWSDPSGKSSYTFDTAQVLRGLLAVLPRLPEVEDTIRLGCEWVIKQIEPTGRVTTPDKTSWCLPDGNQVNENIHLYALEPLSKAGNYFNEPRYLGAVDCALTYYLAQPELTRFNTLSHFHAYVLEALVDLGCLQVAAKGMAEVERVQRKDGAVPAYQDASWVCSTGLAQYAVIWYKLGQRDPAEKALKYLCQIQNPTGGFYGSYGRGANYFPKEEISWAVKFFLDAYHWHIRTSFDADVVTLPHTIDESDGRFQAVLKMLGDSSSLRILDAGCGKGRFAKALSGKYPLAEIWGVDLSEAMLRHVPPEVRTRQGTLLNLPFVDDFFDYAFCIEALEHAIDPGAAIGELCRVVKAGGRVVIVDKNAEHEGALEVEPWERWFGRGEVEAWLRRYCTEVSSEFIVYDAKAEPDGLFLAWYGTRQ